MAETEQHDGWLVRVKRLALRLFPERQIVLRTDGRVSYVVLSHRLQMAIVAVLLVFSGWTTYSSVSYVLNDKILEGKDGDIANARLAYRSLLLEVATYQQKYTTITRDLEENHSKMLGLVEQNAGLQKNLKTVSAQLQSTEQEREGVRRAREELRQELSEVERKLLTINSHNFALKDNLSTVEGDLQQVLGERNQALFEGSQMRRQIATLETRLVDLEVAEIDTVQRLKDRTIGLNENMQKVIQLTGLKPGKLLDASGGVLRGQGGPFIPAKPDGTAAGKLKASLSELDQYLLQSEALQNVMIRLPLASPLTSYRVTSSFGKRRDPVNKKWAAHYGLDMASPLKSGIYVGAAGTVVKAGWKGRYGRFIEIDHGSGIRTRYGHLYKILVKKGQRVNFRDKIGLVGSSGRSTGAHLHYEIAFKGRNLNPVKFFKAGRYVFQE